MDKFGLAGNSNKQKHYIKRYSLFDFWSASHEFMIPKFIRWILNQLNECDQQTPWMRSIDNQPFEQNSGDLFLKIKWKITKLMNVFYKISE